MFMEIVKNEWHILVGNWIVLDLHLFVSVRLSTQTLESIGVLANSHVSDYEFRLSIVHRPRLNNNS